jgi:hypothetical protein
MKLILFSRFTKFGDAFCRSLKKAFHDFAAMLKGKTTRIGCEKEK